MIFTYPMSWLYATAVWIRNMLYDDHILRSTKVNIPTICVGNLAVGGTGKTPMTEYLISLLSKNYRVAVLSRGYGRKTHGFRIAQPEDSALTIGDEPMQIFMHFPHIPIAVCADRVMGVKKLKQIYPDLQCIILDDAFQHRKIVCGYNILLTSYDRLYVNDSFLPVGRLRDIPKQSLRANAIVVTKCPENMRPIDKRVVYNALHLPSYQHLFFSSMVYGNVEIKGKPLVLTGIAHPEYMFQHIQKTHPNAELLAYADHHIFSSYDVNAIIKKAEDFDCIVTTEKDYTRLKLTELKDALADKLCVLPIHMDFDAEQSLFEREVLLYVAENCRKMK